MDSADTSEGYNYQSLVRIVADHFAMTDPSSKQLPWLKISAGLIATGITVALRAVMVAIVGMLSERPLVRGPVYMVLDDDARTPRFFEQDDPRKRQLVAGETIEGMVHERLTSDQGNTGYLLYPANVDEQRRKTALAVLQSNLRAPLYETAP